MGIKSFEYFRMGRIIITYKYLIKRNTAVKVFISKYMIKIIEKLSTILLIELISLLRIIII